LIFVFRTFEIEEICDSIAKKLTKKLCCGSGILSQIPDPEFYPFRIPDLGSQIPDPKTARKDRGEKKICCQTFLCSHKCHKMENYFIF
jgi:hypothetical protein